MILLKPVSALILAAALISAGPAGAASRALLVGVSNYPAEMVGDLQLSGPKNDVALMLETLRGAGFADADMIVLADALGETGETRPADGQPTRAAIMGALDVLARDAAPGDQIMIVMSGHGSQSPITSPASLLYHPDGLNPIFLPIDIGKWNDSVGAVENSIAGDQLGAKLKAIRDKGAFVWVVVDACHSGTITRGAEPGMLAKKIEPSSLGVPLARLEAARAMALAAQPQTRSAAKKKPVSPLASMPASDGGYVAFFAAHPDELAIQRNLPKGYGGGEKRSHGVLVFYLAQAMRAGGAVSYSDLAQMVLAGFDQWGASAPSPMFEGDLRAGVLGAKSPAAKTYPARVVDGALRMDAGVLDQIGEGAIVSLFPAGDPGAPPLGYGRVISASASSSLLAPAARGAAAAPVLAALEDAGRLSARLEERGLALAMTIAMPARPPAVSVLEANAFGAIDALAKEAGGTPLRFVAAEGPADVYLSIAGGRVWFAGEDGQVIASGRGQTPGLPLAGLTSPAGAQAAISQVLRRQLKVRNLIRAAETMGAGPAGQSLEIRAALAQSAPAAAPAGAKAPDDRPCANPNLDKIPEDAAPLESAVDLPALGHCDIVYFSMRNKGAKALDVTPLYIDGGGSIGYMGPPEGLRLLPGAPARIIPVKIVTWDRNRGEAYPIGLERLLFIVVEQEDKTSVVANFSYLKQEALVESQRSMGGSGALKSLLEQAAFGTGGTRSASAGAGTGNAGIAQYRWKVVAPD